MPNPLQIAVGYVSFALALGVLVNVIALLPAPRTEPAMVKIGGALLLGGCDSTYRCCKAHCDRFAGPVTP